MRGLFIGALAGVALLGGCASPRGVSDSERAAGFQPAENARCASATLSIDTDFPAGALANCSIGEGNRVTITLEPEDEPPINCSPWYAFRVGSMGRQEIEVDLTYTACGHRYWPKYSHDGRHWSYFDQHEVKVTDFAGLDRARIRFETDGRPLFIAAQEIVVPSTYEAWLEEMLRHTDTSSFLLGASREGRPIPALTIADREGRQLETVVLIGRQHPPEVTGALVLFPFVETILADNELAKAYRARFQTIVVPMLNPDGVVRGHWRHNTGGTDLNRDWGPFEQPETEQMRELLEAIGSDPLRDLRLFLDFHSTREDVVYTLEKDLETDPSGFTDAWLAAYQDLLPGYEVREQPGHNADSAVSKAWVYERFGAPTATFEIGDETDRSLIPKLGSAAAEAMMRTLLETPRE